MTEPHRRVHLAGVVVELRASTPQLGKYLDWHFGSLPEASGPHDLAIVAGPDGAFTAPLTPPEPDGPMERWTVGEELWLRHVAGGWARVGAHSLELGCPDGPDAWRVTRQLLFSALSWSLDRRGLLLLHGALVGQDDEAVLLLGATGAGKSTAAVAAFAAGWELLSDDLVILSPGQPPRAFGIPKRVMVGASVARRLGVESSDSVPDDRGRMLAPEAWLSHGWRTMRAVLLLEHHSGGGELRPLAQAEALDGLVVSFLEAGRPESLRRQLPAFAGLAALPTFALAHSAIAGDRMARAAELLDDAWIKAGQ